MSSSPASNKILKKNSPYFTSAFSSEWVKKDEKNDGLIIFEKPNISAEDFELIVEITNIFELLVPADELFLTNFIKEIETYLINNHRRWSKKGFGIHYLSMTVRLKICEELQTFAINLFAQNPQILFDSNKHLYMEDDVLFKINSSLTVPSSISTSATLRKGAIDSKILKVKHVALISSWLDQRHVIYYNSQIPYKFALKCRGSEDGFAAEIFRLKSGTIPNTLLIIKVSGTNEILGGYNPTHWGHDRSIKDKSFWRPANNSFIFSMDTDPNKWDSARLSRINPDFSEKAFLISNYSGPQFGNGDLKLGDHFNFKTSSCKKSYYLESIRNTDDNFFSIEEYELFQLVKGV
ncbi:19376_t:CDS:2 [Entrophospora sp. SA101]|nr:19376_t:CDS:2 [Entrophospora sp. SA101]